jgi:hypothetical protein
MVLFRLADWDRDVINIGRKQTRQESKFESNIAPMGASSRYDPIRTIEPQTGLVQVATPDGTGRKILTFEGRPSQWMAQFSAPKRRLARIGNR